MEIKIEKMVMSGKGPKTMYKITCDGKTLFINPKSQFGGFSAWTKKKDAQRIVDAINQHGVDFVHKKLYPED